MRLVFVLLYSIILSTALNAISLDEPYNTETHYLIDDPNRDDDLNGVCGWTLNGIHSGVTFGTDLVFWHHSGGTIIKHIHTHNDVNNDRACYIRDYSLLREIPTCSDGEVFNELADPPQCEALPLDELDDDEDGIKNKCDIKYDGYLELDCDDDGIPNNLDNDFDGDNDGIPDYADDSFDYDEDGQGNKTDIDDDNDGILDIEDEDSPAYGTCLGHDTTATKSFYGNIYNSTSYTYQNSYDGDNYQTSSGTCELTVGADYGNGLTDGVYSLPDRNPLCVMSYCYAHSTTEIYAEENQCDKLYEELLMVCDNNTHKIVGYDSCTENGVRVTNDTLKCVANEQFLAEQAQSEINENKRKCDNRSFVNWNEESNTCDCVEGYQYNDFHDTCMSDEIAEYKLTATGVDLDRINKELNTQHQNEKDSLEDNKANEQADKQAEIQRDILSSTNKQAHDDANTTHTLLKDIYNAIKGHDSNISVTSDLNTSSTSDSNTTDCSSKDSLVDMIACYGSYALPDGLFETPAGWYENNKINLEITLGGGDCQLKTFQWQIGNRTLEFPPRDFVTSLPLELVANLFIALLYIGGLRDFLSK